MIYDKIKNLQEIVGKEAYSLCWPLGGIGRTRKDYFLSKDFIKGHIHCQPFSEDGSFGGHKEGLCDCFLIEKKDKLKKDEIETADLFSYQIPEFYGKKIDESGEVNAIGIEPRVENNFSGKRFVILWKDHNRIEAMIPKKIGKIPSAYKDGEGTFYTGGDTLYTYFTHCIPKLKEDKGIKPIGLWFTDSSLEKTPTINIEDSWDTAMMTHYHPILTEIVYDKEEDKKFGFGHIKNYPKEERKEKVLKIFENDLIGTSRKLADNANGNFLAAYNLHDYIELENEKFIRAGLECYTTDAFGGPYAFLESFTRLVGKKFSNIKVGYEQSPKFRFIKIPVVLASDKEIILQ